MDPVRLCGWLAAGMRPPCSEARPRQRFVEDGPAAPAAPQLPSQPKLWTGRLPRREWEAVLPPVLPPQALARRVAESRGRLPLLAAS